MKAIKMMDGYVFRPATLKDIAFLTKVIIAAEKSNTDKLSFSTLFEVSEEEAHTLVAAMLEEEIDGCELSVSSFMVADFNGESIAAFGGWIEEFEGNKPSSILKSNLIGFTFGRNRIESLKAKADIIKDITAKREALTLQLEYLYVSEKHRGKGIANELISKLIEQAKTSLSNLEKVQVQLFENNTAAFKVYEKSGFVKKSSFTSTNPEILNYLPFNVKIIMEKHLNH